MIVADVPLLELRCCPLLPSAVCREEGVMALWRGWLPSVIGVVPYVGLNFGVYETAKDVIIKMYGAYRTAPYRTVCTALLRGDIMCLAAPAGFTADVLYAPSCAVICSSPPVPMPCLPICSAVRPAPLRLLLRFRAAR